MNIRLLFGLLLFWITTDGLLGQELMQQVSPSKSKGLALFFPVERYRHKDLTNLKNPVKDVKLIAEELQKNYNFETKIHPNLDLDKLQQTLVDYKNSFNDSKFTHIGQLLIYFSGHGIIKDDNGFFLASDSDPNSSFAAGLAYDILRNVINRINCQHIVVVIDACRSGSFDPNWFNTLKSQKPNFSRPGGELNNTEGLIERFNRDTSRFFFTSATLNETPDNSQFTGHFLEALYSGGGEDQILTNSELFYFLDSSPFSPHAGVFGSHNPGSVFLFIGKNQNSIAALPKEKKGSIPGNEENIESTLEKINASAFVENLLGSEVLNAFNEVSLDKTRNTMVFHRSDYRLDSFQLQTNPTNDIITIKTNSLTLYPNEEKLVAKNVLKVKSADAIINPYNSQLEILSDKSIKKLRNATISFIRYSNLHILHNAEVRLFDSNQYEAQGDYKFTVGQLPQTIFFEKIYTRKDSTGWHTIGEANISFRDSFYIIPNTLFQGKVILNPNVRGLRFSGRAKLKASNEFISKQGFPVDILHHQEDPVLSYKQNLSSTLNTLYTGFFLGGDGEIEAVILNNLKSEDQHALFNTSGFMKYDQVNKEHLVGDSLAVLHSSKVAPLMILNVPKKTLKGQGRLDLATHLRNFSIKAAGMITSYLSRGLQTTTTLHEDLTSEKNVVKPQVGVDINAMVGVNLALVPESLMKVMTTDILNSANGAKNVNYLSDLEYYKNTALQLFPKNKQTRQAIDDISSGFFQLPKRYNNYTFLFSRLNLIWNPDYQSFLSKKKKTGLISIEGEPINKILDCTVEFKAKNISNTSMNDLCHIYLKSPSGQYYYFGFKQGVLLMTSSNPLFMDILTGLKKKELIHKMADGSTLEIVPVTSSVPNIFLRRIQFARSQM